MLNHIVLMGRLVADPELRSTNNGTPVASFTIAVDRDFAKEKQTDFINCVAWRQTGEFISKHFHKGRLIAVTGRLESRGWDDKEGRKRVTYEVNVSNAYFTGERKPETVNITPEFTEVPDDGELPF